ncbi:MAG: WxL domain-containing protein [Streptococcaceae bacterium]|jgi:hypothetical protein|nr:WxL domain-containing protein [Streptococcaceae bacterium]
MRNKKGMRVIALGTLALLTVGQVAIVSAAEVKSAQTGVTVDFGQVDAPRPPKEPSVLTTGVMTDPSAETTEENTNLNGTGDLTFTQVPKIFNFDKGHAISGNGFTGAKALSALDNQSVGGQQTVQVYDGRIGYASGWKVTAELSDLKSGTNQLVGATITLPVGQLSNKWLGNAVAGSNLGGTFAKTSQAKDTIIGNAAVSLTAGGSAVDFLEAVDAKTLGVATTGQEIADLSDQDKKLLGYSYSSRFWAPNEVTLDVPTIPTKGNYTGQVTWTLVASANF